MAYATVEQLDSALGYTPTNASLLLDRASRQIDRLLRCAVYDPDDTDIQAALRDATLEQVAYQLAIGNTEGIAHPLQSGVPSGSSAGAVDLSRGQSTGGNSTGAPLIGDQAYSILADAKIAFQGPIPI